MARPRPGIRIEADEVAPGVVVAGGLRPARRKLGDACLPVFGHEGVQQEGIGLALHNLQAADVDRDELVCAVAVDRLHHDRTFVEDVARVEARRADVRVDDQQPELGGVGPASAVDPKRDRIDALPLGNEGLTEVLDPAFAEVRQVADSAELIDGGSHLVLHVVGVCERH